MFSKVTTGAVVTKFGDSPMDSGDSQGAAWADYDGPARLATSWPEIVLPLSAKAGLARLVILCVCVVEAHGPGVAGVV